MKKLIGCISLFIFACNLSGCNSHAASIGVIGGADGPTAIFVTSNINWLKACGFIGIVIVAVLAAVKVYRSKKKK